MPGTKKRKIKMSIFNIMLWIVIISCTVSLIFVIAIVIATEIRARRVRKMKILANSRYGKFRSW